MAYITTFTCTVHVSSFHYSHEWLLQHVYNTDKAFWISWQGISWQGISWQGAILNWSRMNHFLLSTLVFRWSVVQLKKCSLVTPNHRELLALLTFSPSYIGLQCTLHSPKQQNSITKHEIWQVCGTVPLYMSVCISVHVYCECNVHCSRTRSTVRESKHCKELCH